jgi:hypothetical protein
VGTCHVPAELFLSFTTLVLVSISVSTSRSRDNASASTSSTQIPDLATFAVANKPLTREERFLEWESMGLYEGLGNYRYGYVDSKIGLTYGYHAVSRDSVEDIRKNFMKTRA